MLILDMPLMSQEFLAQHPVLVFQRSMAIEPAPQPQGFHRSVQPFRHRFPFDDPVAFA